MITDQDSDKLSDNIKPYLLKFNFSGTKEGLSSQLLTIAINVVRPDLETKRYELVNQTESIRLKLAELDNELLKNLANSEGNLLEKSKLIESLNESKKQAEEQGKYLIETENMQKTFDEERNAYLGLAEKAMNVHWGG